MQRDALHAIDRSQVREHGAERVILAEVRVAVGCDHLQRLLLDRCAPRA